MFYGIIFIWTDKATIVKLKDLIFGNNNSPDHPVVSGDMVFASSQEEDRKAQFFNLIRDLERNNPRVNKKVIDYLTRMFIENNNSGPDPDDGEFGELEMVASKK